MNNKSHNEKPKFQHDCPNCTFLGHHNGHDLYHCMQGDTLPTIIARYSDNGPDYSSGLVFGMADVKIGLFNTPMAQAYMRAKALDLKVSM